MVKKKNIARRSKRPSTIKTLACESETTNSKTLTPLEAPVSCCVAPAPAAPPLDPQTPHPTQQDFPDRVYLLASAVFQNNHLQKPAAHRLVDYGEDRGVLLPEIRDEEMKRAAFELAFSTLKYQELLEDILTDSCFHLTHSIPDDEMSLVAVMLYDLQDRKFCTRKHPEEEQEEEEIIQKVRDIESYLFRCATRLAASLARCRIKHDLSSIDCILPPSVKMKQERSGRLPLYAWINTMRSSLDEVQCVLKSLGFSQVKSVRQLEGQTSCRDPHCGDVLVFPAQLKARLYSTKLLSDHKLIIQDKSCMLGPNVACSMLPEHGDVLMVGSFSGLTISHTACLIAEKHKANNSSNQPTVLVCVNDGTDARREKLQHIVSAMGCKNVKLIPVAFQSLDRAEKRLQKVRVILLTPRCSVSAVSNPVEFILQEHGDTDLLQDLSHGSIAPSKLKALVAQQRSDILHAFKFPQVQAVVYSTCSSYPEENAELMSRTIEEAKAWCVQTGEAEPADFRPSPPVFSSPDNTKAPEASDLFFRLEPSEQSNGCFLAVLTRVMGPVVKDDPQEVLARANAKGLLDRIGFEQQTKKEHHRRSNKTIKATRVSQPHLSLSIQTKNLESMGSTTTTVCGRQTSQEKHGTLRLKALKTNNSIPFSNSKPESSCPPCSEPENSTTTKRITVILNTTTTTSTTTNTIPLHPTHHAPAPVVRPHKAPKEVLKPMMLVLPPVHFPSFFPPRNSRIGFSPSFSNRRRGLTQTGPMTRSSGGLAKDILMKSRPLL